MNFNFVFNPLLTSFIDILAVLTEAQEWKELAKEDEVRISQGEIPLHTTSASAFMFLTMKLKDFQ